MGSLSPASLYPPKPATIYRHIYILVDEELARRAQDRLLSFLYFFIRRKKRKDSNNNVLPAKQR